MDIQSRKIKFIQEFLKLQNEEILSRLEDMLSKEMNDSSDSDFEPMTVQEFNARIDASMEDSKNKHLIKADDLKAKIKKWG